MKVFLDSNIFLRFFVPDDENVYAQCEALLQSVDQGRLRPYTSPIVLIECDFVLSRQYKFPKSRVLDAVERIGALRNMTIVSHLDGNRALRLWRETGVKLADCLIATQVRKGILLVSYDQEFRKLSDLTVVEPREVLEQISNKEEV